MRGLMGLRGVAKSLVLVLVWSFDLNVASLCETILDVLVAIVALVGLPMMFDVYL